MEEKYECLIGVLIIIFTVFAVFVICLGIYSNFIDSNKKIELCQEKGYESYKYISYEFPNNYCYKIKEGIIEKYYFKDLKDLENS